MVSMIVGGQMLHRAAKGGNPPRIEYQFKNLVEHLENTRFFDEEALKHEPKPIVNLRIMYIMEN